MVSLKYVVALFFATITTTAVVAQTKTPAKPAKPAAPKPAASKPAAAKPIAEPTKAETMDWIAGKLKENLAGSREFVSYKDGVLVTKTPGYGYEIILSIDLNNLTGISSEYSSDLIISGKKLYSVEQTHYKGDLSYGQNIYISGPNYDDLDVAFNCTADQALVERLRKAFTALVAFNATKKSESEAY
jgi:hypothetical protein